MNGNLDLQIRQLHEEMSNEPPKLQYRLSSNLPWKDIENHTRLTNGNVADESGQIVQYGRGNVPGLQVYDDSPFQRPVTTEQLKGVEPSKFSGPLDPMAFEHATPAGGYVLTKLNPADCQFVNSNDVGSINPMTAEGMREFKAVMSTRPSPIKLPLEISLVPAEPGDPHVISIGNTINSIKLTDLSSGRHNNRELIYSDGERLVFALKDPEDRQGGTQGHLYESCVYGRGQTKVSTIEFQNGNPSTFGTNGHTNETILSILIHRMEYLDSLFPCEENKEGLKHLKLAKEAFESRAKRLVANLVSKYEKRDCEN